MKSMTGYAKVECTLNDKRLSIEIKTLNSKQLDLIVKLPQSLRAHELEIRAMLSALERGKVECTISEENTGSAPCLNETLLRTRYESLQHIANELHCSTDHLLERLVTMPDIWNTAADQPLDEWLWKQFCAAMNEAIARCDNDRSYEGQVLMTDFNRHVDLIEEMLHRIPDYEQERIQTAKERIRRWMAEAEIREVDENRFEQELIYYLEKLDITEEKVRLQKHIDYFRQTMRDEETCGKKLGFVAQEMGREINTTGSKANHVEIQRLVVAMKDELEKIKEQLGNVL